MHTKQDFIPLARVLLYFDISEEIHPNCVLLSNSASLAHAVWFNGIFFNNTEFICRLSKSEAIFVLHCHDTGLYILCAETGKVLCSALNIPCLIANFLSCDRPLDQFHSLFSDFTPDIYNFISVQLVACSGAAGSSDTFFMELYSHVDAFDYVQAVIYSDCSRVQLVWSSNTIVNSTMFLSGFNLCGIGIRLRILGYLPIADPCGEECMLYGFLYPSYLPDKDPITVISPIPPQLYTSHFLGLSEISVNTKEFYLAFMDTVTGVVYICNFHHTAKCNSPSCIHSIKEFTLSGSSVSFCDMSSVSLMHFLCAPDTVLHLEDSAKVSYDLALNIPIKTKTPETSRMRLLDTTHNRLVF